MRNPKINLFILKLFIYFTPMKQSFTYSGDPKIRKEAMRIAKKEGIKFSSLVESLLKKYVKVEIGDNCDGFHGFLKDQGVEFKPNGSFTTIVEAGKIDLFHLGTTYGEYRQQMKKKINQ